MALSQAEKAILMTAGSEKLQSETRYNFTLTEDTSKIIPLYWQDKDTDGESNTDMDFSTNYPATRVNWKSRCAGGYYNLTAFNTDSNGALLGLTWVTLNKYNFDDFDTALDLQTNIDNTKTSVISGIVQDTLKNDDVSRQFVPHIKYIPLQTKATHFEEGILPSGKGTAPWTTPFAKLLVISNYTPLSTSSVTCNLVQNFYEFSPGTSTSTRSVVEVQE